MKKSIYLSPLTFILAGVVALPLVLSASAIGQEANFGKLALGTGKTSGTLRGTTGGSTSLPAIVSNTDRNNRRCLGFGDPTPDHLLVLQEPFKRLSLRVRSTNTDTTLVVQGPNGIVRCGDDLGSNKNASIQDSDWSSGTYRVWVGTATPSVQSDYMLIVQPE